jgi:hypothetical protein
LTAATAAKDDGMVHVSKNDGRRLSTFAHNQVATPTHVKRRAGNKIRESEKKV